MNRFYLLLLAGLLAVNVMADNKQTLTINGVSVDKNVEAMTFDGDDVVLSYSDGSSDKEDMSLVNLAFDYETTGIGHVETADKVLGGNVYNLNGQLVGNSTVGLRKGIYIVNGKKIVVK